MAAKEPSSEPTEGVSATEGEAPPVALRKASPYSVAVQVGFIAVASLAVFGFVQAAQSDTRRASCTALCSLGPQYAGRNRTVPDFELPDMNGNKVKLSSYRGRTVILNFWTKTCEPCKKEIPALAELAQNLKKNHPEIVLVTVSTDAGPDSVKDTLQVLVDSEQIPFPVLFDPELEVVGDKFGTKLFPETWIIDPKGVIRARFDRALDWSASLPLEVAQMVGSVGGGCAVDFEKGKSAGPFASLCTSD